jgi:hypothetical protein
MFACAVAIALVVLMVCLARMDLNDRRDAQRIPHEVMRLRIKAGVEVFTHEALDDGVSYRVIVQGKNETRHHISGGLSFVNMDAVYIIDDRQYPRHEGLLFDREPAIVCEEDRDKHSYTFAYVGTSRHMSILLRLPQYHQSSSYMERPLKVIIRTLTPAEAMQAKAIADERRRGAEEMQREELDRQARVLMTLAHVDNNFLSPEFQKNYAAKHSAAILKTFSTQWRDEYLALMGNVPLYALIQAEYPLVLEFYEARFEVARIAQRLAVEPPPESPGSKQKRRLSREEWEARIERYRQRQLDRMRVGADDRIAQMLERFESVRRLRERAEDAGLDEDEIEQLEKRLLEDLDQDEDEHTNGYRQL